MSGGYATSLRNAQLDEYAAAVDAGAGGGLIRIYDGTQPSAGAAITSEVLGAELTFSVTAFPAATGGVLTASAVTDDASANASITATWARVLDSNAVFVADYPIADLNLTPSNVIAEFVNVAINNWVLTAGNVGVP